MPLRNVWRQSRFIRMYMLLSLRVACQQRQCATDGVYNAKKEVAAVESDVCYEELH